ncbi:MAG: hypothetical protein RIT81_12885 [Deltaproteobacteria bacterium]
MSGAELASAVEKEDDFETGASAVELGVSVAALGFVAYGGAKTAKRSARDAIGNREIYDRISNELGEMADGLVKKGYSDEAVVREISPLRNELKANNRDRGSWIGKKVAEMRNKRKYGDSLGPSPEALRAYYKGSWYKARKAISRTNARVSGVVKTIGRSFGVD